MRKPGPIEQEDKGVTGTDEPLLDSRVGDKVTMVTDGIWGEDWWSALAGGSL